MLTEDGPFDSDTITNSYVNRLRTQLSLQQPTGFWTNGFTYDAGARLSNVTMRAGTFIYSYLPGTASKLVTNLQLPNTSRITNGFDANARLLKTALLNSGNSALDSYAYACDPANERTNLARLDGSTVGFLYDKIGQLTVADSSVSTEDRGYKYDAAWNLNWRTNNGSASQFQVDNQNELTNYSGTTCGYDSNGNLTSAGVNKLYVYDDENRLVQWFSYQTSCTSPQNGDLRTDFIYDGLGRLRQRLEYTLNCPTGGGTNGDGSVAQQLDSGGTGCIWMFSSGTQYIYDGWRVIQERDTNNTPVCAYTRGSDLSGTMEGAGGIGGLLARTRYFAGGPTSSHFYFSDGNGNVTYMIDTNQSMVASYRYDPFGNTISSSGSLADENVYRFSSKEVHANSGMYYYGYRFYDPSLQRFINRDPIAEAGGYNLYCFVANNPPLFIDPYGLDLDDLRIDCPPLQLPQPPPLSLVPPPPPPLWNVWYPPAWYRPTYPDYSSPPFTLPPKKGPLDYVTIPSISGPLGGTISPVILQSPFTKSEGTDLSGDVVPAPAGGGFVNVGAEYTVPLYQPPK